MRSWEGQERGELLPVHPPQPHDRRVATVPPVGERVDGGAGRGGAPPDHHAVTYGDPERVGPALYRKLH